MNRNFGLTVFLLVLMAACGTVAFTDKVYTLNAPATVQGTLMGPDANGDQDLPLSDCAPEPVPSPSPHLEYKCVVHFLSDYQALLDEIASLQEQLKACQGK